jgi:hypothetical protein
MYIDFGDEPVIHDFSEFSLTNSESDVMIINIAVICFVAFLVVRWLYRKYSTSYSSKR